MREERDEYVTLSQAADLLGVTLEKVHALIKDGALPPLQLGMVGHDRRLKLLSRDDVERLRQSRQGYMTMAQAARMLGFSPQKLQLRIDAGELPPTIPDVLNKGGRLLPQADVERYAEAVAAFYRRAQPAEDEEGDEEGDEPLAEQQWRDVNADIDAMAQRMEEEVRQKGGMLYRLEQLEARVAELEAAPILLRGRLSIHEVD